MNEFEITPEAKVTRHLINELEKNAGERASWAMGSAMHGIPELILGSLSLKGSIDTGHQFMQHLWDGLYIANISSLDTADATSVGLLTVGSILLIMATRNAVMVVSDLVAEKQYRDRAMILNSQLYQSYLDRTKPISSWPTE